MLCEKKWPEQFNMNTKNAKTVVLTTKIKHNLQQDTCKKVSGNSVMGSIAETHWIAIEVCVLGEGRKKKRNPTQSKKPLPALQCNAPLITVSYQSMHA